MTRTWLIAAFLVGVVLSIGDLVAPRAAPFVSSLVPVPGTTDTYVVTSTDRFAFTGEPLSVGDHVVPVAPTWKSRIIGNMLTVRNVRSGAESTLTDVYSRNGYAEQQRPILLVDVVLELFAIALLVMRGERKDVRWLAVTIFLTAFSFPFQRGAFLGAEVALLYQTIDGVLIVGAVWALLELASAVAPPAVWIIRVKWSVGMLALLASAFTFTRTLVHTFTGFLLPGFVLFMQEIPALVFLGALIIFTASIRSAPRPEQRRLALLAISSVLGNADVIVAAVSPTQIFTLEQIWISYVGMIAMTVGLAYAVLIERMFDIGFVVNRAVVYAATSGFVVLAFIAIEWFVAKVATNIGHLGSTVVELGLAIGVGLGLRPVHERVDTVIDAVFFAARHRAANALLRFSEECAESRTVPALIELTLERLSVYARPDACAIYLANDDGDLVATSVVDGFPTLFAVDDATTIRLRTSRDAVERLSFPMLKVADYAFPMTRRGGLAGAIFIRLGTRAEPYSPEERDAIAAVARSCGNVIVALEAAALQRLVAETPALRDQLDRMSREAVAVRFERGS